MKTLYDKKWFVVLFPIITVISSALIGYLYPFLVIKIFPNSIFFFFKISQSPIVWLITFTFLVIVISNWLRKPCKKNLFLCLILSIILSLPIFGMVLSFGVILLLLFFSLF